MRHLFAILFLFSCFAVTAQDEYAITNKTSQYTNRTKHKVIPIDYQSIDFAAKPKNIILLIGDGMGLGQIQAAMTANRGMLNINNMPYIGFSKTQSKDNYITDSGAGATAIACGVKTYNDAIGVNINKKPVENIIEKSVKHKLQTGIIATSILIHATPAAFVAHQPHRMLYENIALDFLYSEIDLLIGGGSTFFEKRLDGRNLIEEFSNMGYTVKRSLKEASDIDSGKLIVFTAANQNPSYKDRGSMLEKSTDKAIQILNKSPNGFFVMIEGSQIDWGNHQNNIEYVIGETLDFDKAVGAALNFAAEDKQTLVIVTADHESGGLSIIDGDNTSGRVVANFSTVKHTGVMVPVFAFGPGAENFIGI